MGNTDKNPSDNININDGICILNGMKFDPSSYLQTLYDYQTKGLKVASRGAGRFIATFNDPVISAGIPADVKVFAVPEEQIFDVVICPKDFGKKKNPCAEWFKGMLSGDAGESGEYDWGKIVLKEPVPDTMSKPEIRILYGYKTPV